ncbi:TonB-dependent receptor [Altererythrobacter marinus]|uniref:TonB-dependent receptor n=1 Tax=Pelagerythrobacter marinus TaxID=538382 RepID=A0ABW9UWG7_9SPHN|nr:TonB-dependent receptor [Pelagerythrobacter marinus]MXO68950.1 TonB-dependent receptor [Pelagerythrobacter marinus]
MLYRHAIANRSLALPVALALCAVAAPAHAQDARAQDRSSDPGAAPAAPETDDFHDRRIAPTGEIVVTATGLEQLDVLAGTTVVEGAELQRNLDGQIGEVLIKVPGVSATGFAPGASRPVLRGFSGERVKVLIDGIGAIDASNTSADHATAIDPLTAERIEVLRGPAVLLYGSQAIGGAVNVIDKRIPLRRLNEPFHLDALAGVDTASDLREGGASLDVPLGERFVVHVDGAYRKTGDLEIPGYVVVPELRADLLADAAEEEEEGHLEEAEELREAANHRGTLPGSATETWSANAGFAFFEGDSNLGASFGIYDTTYGVPLRPGTSHHHGEEDHDDDHDHEHDDDHDDHEDHEGEEEHGHEDVTIALRQYRADLRGRLALGDGFLAALNTRVGFSDYTHTEFEGDEVGTVFEVKGIEARAELEQNRRGNWGGSTGIQYYYRDFDAYGAEAYVPKNHTDQVAVFTLQEIDFDPFQVELAARYEATDVESQVAGFDRSFDTFSGALGLIYETAGGLRFGVTGSRAERAPSAEELLSDGPHIATQAYEIGDRDLEVEGAWGLEAFVRGALGDGTVSLAVYRNWFDDYIYLAETGEEEDELPVFQYLQGDARYFGVEGQVTYPLYQADGFTLMADLRGDYVRAELDDGTPLPRIPPLRLLGALEAQTGPVDARVEVQWFDGQDRVAPFESATDAFTFVNASIAWKPLRGNDNVTVLLQANNLFDAEGRRHASFTKDFVPLAGRNFKIGLRTSF